MITAALEGNLNEVEVINYSAFGVAMPTSCPDVPREILNLRDTWKGKDAYVEEANNLGSSLIGTSGNLLNTQMMKFRRELPKVVHHA